MRALFIALFAIILNANPIPSKTYSSVVSINGNKITLSNPIGPVNTGGVVIRNINGKNYITAYIKQSSNNSAQVVELNYLGANKLANIKPLIMPGDRVIGAFLYNKVLILAPNQDILRKVEYKLGVKSINPDYFKSYSNNSNKAILKEFAQKVGIGLIIIVKDNKIKIYDPFSFTTINTITL